VAVALGEEREPAEGADALDAVVGERALVGASQVDAGGAGRAGDVLFLSFFLKFWFFF